MPDKKEEKVVGKYFLKYLNKKYKSNFFCEENKNEGKIPYIDLYVKSRSEKEPSFNLQIVVSDGIIKRESARLREKSKKTEQKVVAGGAISLDFCNWIKREIEKKENKNSYKGKKKEIVLLVKYDFGSLSEEYAKECFKELEKSGFFGVYAIHLPQDKNECTESHDGQIIEIKSIPNSWF